MVLVFLYFLLFHLLYIRTHLAHLNLSPSLLIEGKKQKHVNWTGKSERAGRFTDVHLLAKNLQTHILSSRFTIKQQETFRSWSSAATPTVTITVTSSTSSTTTQALGNNCLCLSRILPATTAQSTSKKSSTFLAGVYKDEVVTFSID